MNSVCVKQTNRKTNKFTSRETEYQIEILGYFSSLLQLQASESVRIEWGLS